MISSASIISSTRGSGSPAPRASGETSGTGSNTAGSSRGEPVTMASTSSNCCCSASSKPNRHSATPIKPPNMTSTRTQLTRRGESSNDGFSTRMGAEITTGSSACALRASINSTIESNLVTREYERAFFIARHWLSVTPLSLSGFMPASAASAAFRGPNTR